MHVCVSFRDLPDKWIEKQSIENLFDYCNTQLKCTAMLVEIFDDNGTLVHTQRKRDINLELMYVAEAFNQMGYSFEQLNKVVHNLGEVLKNVK